MRRAAASCTMHRTRELSCRSQGSEYLSIKNKRPHYILSINNKDYYLVPCLHRYWIFTANAYDWGNHVEHHQRRARARRVQERPCRGRSRSPFQYRQHRLPHGGARYLPLSRRGHAGAHDTLPHHLRQGQARRFHRQAQRMRSGGHRHQDPPLRRRDPARAHRAGERSRIPLARAARRSQPIDDGEPDPVAFAQRAHHPAAVPQPHQRNPQQPAAQRFEHRGARFHARHAHKEERLRARRGSPRSSAPPRATASPSCPNRLPTR